MHKLKFLFASDAFKGSLSSHQINELLTQAAAEIFPQAETISLCVADGGEGTMETVVNTTGGSWQIVSVLDPLGHPIAARYGILPEQKAMIEMAQASGLPLVPPDKRNAELTSSIGTGMLIKNALDAGIRDITIAIGGSATNDGGMGVMQALGIRFTDKNGQELSGCGASLDAVEQIDISGLHPAVQETQFTVMCDVTNLLLGANGATYTFGRQKGADDDRLDRLEHGMAHYAHVVQQTLGCDTAGLPGAGAAGGLGFALMTFLHAQPQSGIETVLDLLHFDEQLADVDLVITGEGRMDVQSSYGKVPAGVGMRCKRAGIPTAAIVGGLLPGYEAIYDYGIDSIVTTVNGAMDIETAMKNSKSLYLDAARRLFRLIHCGMSVQ